MAEPKTRPTRASAARFVAGVESEVRRRDAERLLELFEAVTGEEPVMWGDSIVGFGSYEFEYETGRTGTWLRVGFSPRKANLTLYLLGGFDELGELLARLGRHRLGKSCLYITRLDDVELDVLGELIAAGYRARAMGERAD